MAGEGATGPAATGAALVAADVDDPDGETPGAAVEATETAGDSHGFRRPRPRNATIAPSSSTAGSGPRLCRRTGVVSN